MAHTESITFQEFRARFSTENACWAELFRLRFPNGFACPKCGCTEYYPVRGEARSSAVPADARPPSPQEPLCTARICR